PPSRPRHLLSPPFPYPTLFRSLTLSGSPAWTQLAAFGRAPLPRYGHGAIYDPVRDRMAIFGASFYYTDDVRALSFVTGYTLDVSDRKSTRLNSSHEWISYAVFC